MLQIRRTKRAKRPCLFRRPPVLQCPSTFATTATRRFREGGIFFNTKPFTRPIDRCAVSSAAERSSKRAVCAFMKQTTAGRESKPTVEVLRGWRCVVGELTENSRRSLAVAVGRFSAIDTRCFATSEPTRMNDRTAVSIAVSALRKSAVWSAIKRQTAR